MLLFHAPSFFSPRAQYFVSSSIAAGVLWHSATDARGGVRWIRHVGANATNGLTASTYFKVGVNP